MQKERSTYDGKSNTEKKREKKNADMQGNSQEKEIYHILRSSYTYNLSCHKCIYKRPHGIRKGNAWSFLHINPFLAMKTQQNKQTNQENTKCTCPCTCCPRPPFAMTLMTKLPALISQTSKDNHLVCKHFPSKHHNQHPEHSALMSSRMYLPPYGSSRNPIKA